MKIDITSAKCDEPSALYSADGFTGKIDSELNVDELIDEYKSYIAKVFLSKHQQISATDMVGIHDLLFIHSGRAIRNNKVNTD